MGPHMPHCPTSQVTISTAVYQQTLFSWIVVTLSNSSITASYSNTLAFLCLWFSAPLGVILSDWPFLTVHGLWWTVWCFCNLIWRATGVNPWTKKVLFFVNNIPEAGNSVVIPYVNDGIMLVFSHIRPKGWKTRDCELAVTDSTGEV